MQLNLSNIEYTYPTAAEPALRGVSATFPQGWTGIVGDNGGGKTTLTLVACGILRPDSGSVSPSLLSLYCSQDATEPPQNLEDFALAYDGDATRLRRDLGIEDDWPWRYGTLSGGQQKRLALATALIQPCDLLLLDEPTNHLDSETIAWLEEYLRGQKGALLMVTHDRYFLDNTATKILELDKGSAYTYTGNYSSFLEQKEARIEREEASEQKRQNFLRNELKWLRRGAQARSTKQRARIERYEEVKNKKVDLDRSTVEIGLAGSRLGRTVIELDHVSYEVGGRTIIRDFSYTVLRNDRVAILGRNGTGKSTLLNIFAGRLQPTSGTVTIGQTVKIGYFTQRAVSMDERLRAIEYIQEAARAITLADGSRISAKELMERFLFPGELQWTPIARLSGGEKRRLFLLRILMEEPNVLLLDEPTNDLDLETMSVLESFIDDFRGAILFVSHDRFFVDRLADKVFVYQPDGSLRLYAGGYSYYKEKEREEEAKKAQQAPPAAEAKKEREPKKAQERPAREAKRRLSFGEQKEYAEIEGVIASKEGELKVVRLEMQQNASDYTRLAELGREETRLAAELDHLMERWAYLEEIAEQQDS